MNRRFGLLDGEKDPGNLIKRIQELERRLRVLEDTANTGDLSTLLGYGAFDVRARVYNSGNITLSTASWTAVTFDSERWDTDSIHDVSANTDRLTCRTTGLYIIAGHVRFETDGTGNRGLYIAYNGATLIGMVRKDADSATPTVLTIATQYYMSVGDYLKLAAYQSSGGDLDVEAVANYSPEFMMVRVA